MQGKPFTQLAISYLMKRIVSLTLLLLTVATGAFAQSNRAMLKLRLSDRSLISVYLDGRYIYRETPTLTLDGLRPGLHRLEVYSEVGYRRHPIRIYTGTIRLTPATVNVGIVDVYDRGMRLRTRPMDDVDYTERDQDRRDGYENDRLENRDGYNDDRRDNRDGRDDIYEGDKNNNPSDKGEGYGSFPHGRGGDANTYAPNAFGQRDMDDLRDRVTSRVTDSDKEQLMKTSLKNRTVYTDQVRQMLGWLSFDDTRLDFAKWAYDFAGDKQNYWKLEDAFSFSSTKETFNKEIRSH